MDSSPVRMTSSPLRPSSPVIMGSSPVPGMVAENMSDLGSIAGASILSRQDGGRKRRAFEQHKKQQMIPQLDDADMEVPDQWTIWGTTVNVQIAEKKFTQFFEKFKVGDTFKYPALVQNCVESEDWGLNLDASHLAQFDQELYNNLICYPQTMVPIFDTVVDQFAQANYSDEMDAMDDDVRISVRPFNLRTSVAMRQLNPEHIDNLIAMRGMVIRATSVVPDLQEAFFRCSMCGQEVRVQIVRGRVDEPSRCPNQHCQSNYSMRLVHNRSAFWDKQLVKIQETPDAIPEGETPQTIDIWCYDDLVDVCKPGDRVEVTGIYKAREYRQNSKRRAVESVYKTYIDSVHIRKSRVAAMGSEEDGEKEMDYDETDETQALKAERMERCKNLSKEPDLYNLLTRSVAPSIWEMEDIKKGILCQLFGAVTKDFSNAGGGSFRGDLNVLLCGDPGTSKSQLLQYAHKVAPRGIYTSGKGSSAVGLTAYIARDPETKDLVLESGALVLSDRGTCCIDEFDKMGDSARSILHEVMEQQTVSIAKAGIICTLNARTSILAAANPIESRYNPKKSVVENIDLPPTLLSRFDLIYLVLDQPNQALDRKLANHIVSLYYKDEDRDFKEQDIIPMELLMEYITYSKKHIHPKLTNEAGEALVQAYLKMRDVGRDRGRKTITATPRQLESLIRLSESLARMEHSKHVKMKHVEEAKRLYMVATQQAATDPRTGRIDVGIISTGQSEEDRAAMLMRCDQIMEIIKGTGESTVKAKKLLSDMENKNNDPITMQDLKKVVDRLHSEGRVRPPRNWMDENPVIQVIDTGELL